MITATTWVPRGFAAEFPQRIDVTEEEYERIADLARLQLEDAQDDLDDARAGVDEDDEEVQEKKKKKGKKATVEVEDMVEDDKDDEEIDDDLKEYDLENYDEPTEEEKKAGENMGMFGNIKGLAYYQPGEADPYITMNEQAEDEEREELQILPTDNLLIAAGTEDDICHLEIYVYEDSDDNLYVHHDIMLPAIPLCVEWLDIPVGASTPNTPDSRGNYVAVGTMDPDIEIWNLDTIDTLYPNAILGASPTPQNKPKKPKKNKKQKQSTTHHTDAVLSLAANRQHRNLLASASADKTVKLWDLNTTKCAKSYSHHTDKVCALSWHPTTSTTLLSGSYDRTVVWADMRAPDAAVPRWGVESDVEDVKWDPHDTHYFYVSTEGGTLHFFDTRILPSSPETSRPVWTLQAHDKSVSAFDVSPIIPGFLVSGGLDKQVKLWNTQTGTGGPSMVAARDLGVGKVFSTRFAPDREVGFRLSVAGSKGAVTVWDTSTNAGVRRVFAGRVAGIDQGEVEERVVAVESSGESDSEEGEDEGEKGPDGWESMDEEEG